MATERAAYSAISSRLSTPSTATKSGLLHNVSRHICMSKDKTYASYLLLS